MKTLVSLLFLFALGLGACAQAPATTAQPLSRDATSFNLNRTRLDFGSGQTLKFESGSVFTLENGATFSIGPTAAADLATALGLGFGNATFADTAARDAASAAATGQLGVQIDDGTLWRAGSATAGDWSGAFGVVSLGVGSGAVGAPALSFTTEATTGLYRVGAGQVGVTISGALAHQFNAGSMLFPNGTVALPGLAFLADADTGIYRVGANKVGIAANGVLAAQVNETQVWIGSGTEAAPALAFFNANDTGMYYDDATEKLSFAVAGSAVLQFDAAGTLDFSGRVNAAEVFASTGYVLPMILGGAGTAAEPAISPTGDSNTGFFFPALDQVGISCLGSASATFSVANCSFNAVLSSNFVTAAGKITGGSFALIKADDTGTAAAPFFTRAADTDTGMYFSAANEVALSAGGTQVAKWTTVGGSVTGVLVVSGNVSGANGTFSGAVSGTTGTFSGAVSVASLSSTAAIPLASGGTAATTAAGARTALGVTSATNTALITNQVTLASGYYPTAAFTANARNKVILNTEVYDPDGLVTFSDANDNFSIDAAGTYRIDICVKAMDTSSTVVILRNSTDSTDLVSTFQYISTAPETGGELCATTRVTLAGAKTYELQIVPQAAGYQFYCSGALTLPTPTPTVQVTTIKISKE